jgi:hypothetical protein
MSIDGVGPNWPTVCILAWPVETLSGITTTQSDTSELLVIESQPHHPWVVDETTTVRTPNLQACDQPLRDECVHTHQTTRLPAEITVLILTDSDRRETEVVVTMPTSCWELDAHVPVITFEDLLMANHAVPGAARLGIWHMVWEPVEIMPGSLGVNIIAFSDLAV